MKEKKIYITGLGVYTPAGYGIEEVWNNLSKGNSGIKRRTEWANSNIKNHLYGLPPSISFKDEIEWKEMFSPTYYSILGMYACKKAIEDANLTLNNDTNEIGMVIDTSMGSAFYVEEYLYDLYERGLSRISPIKFTKTVTNTAIGDISRFFKLNGISSLLLNECSLCYGLDLIKKGLTDIIICGAIDHFTDYYILSEQETNGLVDETLSLKEFISETKNVQKKILGEGACFIVLETADSLQKRNGKVYAELIDYKTTFDPDNVMSTTQRSLYTLQNNLSIISRYIPNNSNILWESACLTDIQREINEPSSIINSLSTNKIYQTNHKFFTGDMRSASNLFGILSASKSLQEQKIPNEFSPYKTESIDVALVNTAQEGGSSTIFLLKNIND